MNSTTSTRRQLAFLLGVPLAWAVLLLFHGPGPGADAYGNLQDEASRFMVVHIGMVVFIGLMGIALYLLVRDLPGTAARISRLAIGPFVLLYAAGEAVQGIAVGLLVEHTGDAPAADRPALADAAQAVYDATAGELLANIGAIAWVVAVIAAAVAYRRVGASVGVTALLGLSSIAILHAPPIGPAGLLCFAAAAGLLAHRQGTSRTVEPPVIGAKA